MLVLLSLLVPAAMAVSPLSCHSLFAKTPSSKSSPAWIQQIDEQHLENSKQVSLQEPWPQQDARFFQSLLAHKKDLTAAPPQYLLKVFEAFARRNLIPPPSFERSLIETMRNSLYEWRESDISSFASLRKLTPLRLDPSFLSSWRTLIALNFEDWQLKTQLEVLGSELYHNASYDRSQWDTLISQTTANLAQSKKLQSLKSLKELYRGLMFVDSQKTSISPELIDLLITQIQIHLQRHELSLSESGRSGSLAPTRNIGWPVGRLQILMDHEFPHSLGQTEYADPTRPGFFDPVDLYYSDLRLVIEWDGGQHYFRTLLETGDLAPGTQLRPFDAAKDATLRRQGFLVLRLSSEDSTLLENFSLRELIEKQNPGAELPPEHIPQFYLNVRDSTDSN